MREIRLADNNEPAVKKENRLLTAERLAAEELYREAYRRRLEESQPTEENVGEAAPRAEYSEEAFEPTRKDNFTYTIPDTLPTDDSLSAKAESISEPTVQEDTVAESEIKTDSVPLSDAPVCEAEGSSQSTAFSGLISVPAVTFTVPIGEEASIEPRRYTGEDFSESARVEPHEIPFIPTDGDAPYDEIAESYSPEHLYDLPTLGDVELSAHGISDVEHTQNVDYSVESNVPFVDAETYTDTTDPSQVPLPTRDEIEEEYERVLREDKESRSRKKVREEEHSEDGSYNLTGDYEYDVKTATDEAERLIRKRMAYIQMNLGYKADMLSVTYGPNSDKDEHRAEKMRERAAKARRKTRLALKLERRDVLRYYAAYFDKYDGDPTKRVRAVGTLESVKRRIDYVLSRIAQLDEELLELYTTEGAGDKRAKLSRSKLTAIRSAKRLHKAQRKLAKRIKKLRAPADIKDKLYELLNDKTKAHATLAYVKYELRHSKPTREHKRELQAKRREAKRTLRYIDADVDKYMKRADKYNTTHSANKQQFLWIILLLLLIGGGAYLYFKFPEFFEGIVSRFKGGA